MFPFTPFNALDSAVAMVLCLYWVRKDFLVLQVDVKTRSATISVISTVDLLLMVISIGSFSPGTKPDFGNFPEILRKFFFDNPSHMVFRVLRWIGSWNDRALVH